MCDSRIAGTATITILISDAISGGMVLPIAWNMLPFTKMIPDAIVPQLRMRRYWEPTG